jgi:hypothetical protein
MSLCDVQRYKGLEKDICPVSSPSAEQCKSESVSARIPGIGFKLLFVRQPWLSATVNFPR